MTDPVTVSPLRQRMIEDMTIRRFGGQTQRDYVRQVRAFNAERTPMSCVNASFKGLRDDADIGRYSRSADAGGH